MNVPLYCRLSLFSVCLFVYLCFCLSLCYCSFLICHSLCSYGQIAQKSCPIFIIHSIHKNRQDFLKRKYSSTTTKYWQDNFCRRPGQTGEQVQEQHCSTRIRGKISGYIHWTVLFRHSSKICSECAICQKKCQFFWHFY